MNATIKTALIALAVVALLENFPQIKAALKVID